MTLDHVFTSNSTTEEIFREKILKLIESTLHGINLTVMAYGQTSSGKTYTMQGNKS